MIFAPRLSCDRYLSPVTVQGAIWRGEIDVRGSNKSETTCDRYLSPVTIQDVVWGYTFGENNRMLCMEGNK